MGKNLIFLNIVVNESTQKVVNEGEGKSKIACTFKGSIRIQYFETMKANSRSMSTHKNALMRIQMNIIVAA